MSVHCLHESQAVVKGVVESVLNIYTCKQVILTLLKYYSITSKTVGIKIMLLLFAFRHLGIEAMTF